MISCLLDNVLILHEKLQVDQVRRSEQNTFKRWDILDQHSDKYGFIKVISYDSQKTASAVGSQNTRNQRSWSEEKRHTRKWIGQCESVKSTSMLIIYLWFRATFNWLSKVIRDVIGFAFLCSVIVPKKLAPLSHQIRCTTKTNHDLITCVSPLFGWFLLWVHISS